MDEGSYMCHNCQGSGSLALGPSCSSMLYVAGLVTALRGGAPMVGAIPALVRVYGCRHPGARHWESSHQQGMQGLDGAHHTMHVPPLWPLRCLSNGRRLRNYGITDLPPSLPLPRADPETRISESKRGRSASETEPEPQQRMRVARPSSPGLWVSTEWWPHTGRSCDRCGNTRPSAWLAGK